MYVGRKTVKMRRYRQNVKNDPERYEKMKLKDKERKRKEREQLKKARRSDQAVADEIKRQKREQQQRFRSKLKAKESKKKAKQSNNSAKMNDLMEKLKESKKLLKQKQAVLRTQMWRMKIKLKTTEKETKDTCTSPYQSRTTEYRAVQKAKQCLPMTREKRAQIIERLIDSPTLSAELERKGAIMGKAVKKQLRIGENVIKNLKHSLNETKKSGGQFKEQQVVHETMKHGAMSSIARKYGLQKELRHILQLGTNTKLVRKGEKWWLPKTRKRRRDRISDELRETVKEFYLDPNISREVPCKRECINVTENGKKKAVVKHLMTLTVKDAYKCFKEKCPDTKMGFKSFRKLKPPAVKRVTETNKRSCLCRTCCNAALKCEALQTISKSSEEIENMSKDLIFDKKEINKMTLCENPKSSCIERNCKGCSVKKISEYYSEIAKYCSERQLKITWDYITIKKDEKEKKIMPCVQKETTFEEFINKDFEQIMTSYAAHIFRAAWQHNQMSACLKNLEEGQVMTVMDFSKNYKCGFQNEPQDAFFDQNLVTIHPMMYYYRKRVDDKIITYKHSIIGISDDLKHDSHLVSHFEAEAIKIVKEKVEVKEIFEWTDGCVAQYKGKKSFYDISNYDIKKTRNYFETSHGKNVCDGLGAIVKCSCYRAMLGKKVIGTAQDVYCHCKETLENTSGQVKVNGEVNVKSLREFIYLGSANVNRENAPVVATLKGTRQIHEIKNTLTSGEVMHRNLSCYCHGCKKDGICTNNEYVEQWECVALKVQESASGILCYLFMAFISTVSLTHTLLNRLKLASPIADYQPIKLLDIMYSLSSQSAGKSANPDQMAL